MEEQINVLVVEPGFAPYEKAIADDYREMQKIVGGLITAIYPYEEPVAIVANDEGILLGMDFNRSVEGGYGCLGSCGPEQLCRRRTDQQLCQGGYVLGSGHGPDIWPFRFIAGSHRVCHPCRSCNHPDAF